MSHHLIPYLSSFSGASLERAQRRLDAIKPLLAASRTGAEVAKVAETHGVSIATIYRWLRCYDTALATPSLRAGMHALASGVGHGRRKQSGSTG